MAQPRALVEVLPGCLGGYSPHLGVAALVHAAWARVVGPPVSLHAQPADFSGGVLWVVASSSGWAHELTFLREDIRRRLCAELGAETVGELRFRVGAVEPPKPRRDATPARAPDRDVSDDERRAIEADLEAVADDDVRTAIRRARLAYAKRGRPIGG